MSVSYRIFAGFIVLALLIVAAPVAVTWLVDGLPGCAVPLPADRLPVYGENFGTYCLPCILALRTYGRGEAVAATMEAYGTLARSHPDVQFVYGEVGFPWGGPFPPHRTHREGLSVDFMMPLRNNAVLPTHMLNRYGYDEEFDSSGRGDSGQIDFGAAADHLIALRAAARRQGGDIRRIYFAPDLQDDLFAASPALRSWGVFNTRQAWVRHDDHYHVDFAFPCPHRSG